MPFVQVQNRDEKKKKTFLLIVCHCSLLFNCCCAFYLRLSINLFFVLVLKSERCIDVSCKVVSKTDNDLFL